MILLSVQCHELHWTDNKTRFFQSWYQCNRLPDSSPACVECKAKLYSLISFDTCWLLDQILYSVGRPLDLARDGSKYMKEYHFINMETLVFIERSRGGSNLQALESHVQLTKEPCCVTFEDDDKEWRAKLACGHVVSKYGHYAQTNSAYTVVVDVKKTFK